MKTPIKFCPIIIAVSAILLNGCNGSDNDTPHPEKPPQDSIENKVNPAWEFIEVPQFEFKNTKLQGYVEFYLGKTSGNSLQWIFEGMSMAYGAGDFSRDLNGDGRIDRYDTTLAGVKDEVGTPFKVNTADMISYLQTNPDGLGSGTARPDIFVEGQYSAFDLLRYLVGTRDDLQFEGPVTSYKDSEYNTFEFSISWDTNGDGAFNSDDGEYYNSPLWHFGFRNSKGMSPSQFYNYLAKGHAPNYKRMDQFWLREDQSIRFMPFSEHMTNRRHWVWKQEQDRLAKNDGKFIIPLIIRSGDKDGAFGLPGEEIVERNVEVKPFNLRSDVFQPGVVTSMDVWLTMAKDYGYDFRFTWWPITITGAISKNFVLSHTPWSGEFTAWSGTSPYQGELAAGEDFFRRTLPECNFTKEGVPTKPGEGEIDQATCFEEFFSAFGGNYLSEPLGANVLPYPPEYMELHAHSYEIGQDVLDLDLHEDPKITVYVAEKELQHTNLNANGDFDLYPSEDVTGTASLSYFPAATESTKVGKAPLLSENHFGWKIADCTLCHNEERQPLGHGGQAWPTNKADGFDFIQPYYCASCHGSNGAPDSHGRGASCFWCHNSNNGEGLLPPKHGDVSKPKFIPAEKLVANHRPSGSQPVGNDGTIKFFDDMWAASPNSNYTLSKTFPDPFSCGTCHGTNEEYNQ